MANCQKLVVNGGRRLEGELRVHGAKNSALPLLAACVLAHGECVLHNCPELTDVTRRAGYFPALGAGVPAAATRCAWTPPTSAAMRYQTI